jgi:hypothetical protein
MKWFKLGLGNKTILEQIGICRRVAGGIAKLPAHHREALARHQVDRYVEEAAKAHFEVGRLKIALRAAVAGCRRKVEAMRGHTTAAAYSLMLITKGEPAALLAAGLDVVRDKQPVGKPGAPQLLRVVPTDYEGLVRLRWKRPVRRCIFIIEMTTGKYPKGDWKKIDRCIRQTHDITKLPSGKKVWFRVCATNAHGQGPWSQAVSAWVK